MLTSRHFVLASSSWQFLRNAKESEGKTNSLLVKNFEHLLALKIRMC